MTDTRIPGTLLHQCEDEHGPIFVFKDDGRRILSFDGIIEQSSVWLDDPARILYPYAQTMMLGLLLTSAPQRIAVLGLGGGTLAAALLRHAPNSLIEAVELRAEVVRIARDYLGLPNHPQLTVHTGDARVYLAEYLRDLDMIFADLFLQAGMNALQTEADFLRSARAALTANGVLALNVWNADREACRATLKGVDALFDGATLALSVPAGNSVIFAFKNALPHLDKKRFMDEARRLGKAMGAPLAHFADQLWRENIERLAR